MSKNSTSTASVGEVIGTFAAVIGVCFGALVAAIVIAATAVIVVGAWTIRVIGALLKPIIVVALIYLGYLAYTGQLMTLFTLPPC